MFKTPKLNPVMDNLLRGICTRAFRVNISNGHEDCHWGHLVFDRRLGTTPFRDHYQILIDNEVKTRTVSDGVLLKPDEVRDGSNDKDYYDSSLFMFKPLDGAKFAVKATIYDFYGRIVETLEIANKEGSSVGYWLTVPPRGYFKLKGKKNPVVVSIHTGSCRELVELDDDSENLELSEICEFFELGSSEVGDCWETMLYDNDKVVGRLSLLHTGRYTGR